MLRQPDLARTLRRIQAAGPDGFYRGDTAELIHTEMERGGGLLTREDLVAYRAVWREPVLCRYRGHSVISVPPPSAGRTALVLCSHILGFFPLGETSWHGRDHVHLLAEAWKRAYTDVNHYLADPDSYEMPMATLTSPDYAAWRARAIPPASATPAAELRPGVEAYRAGPSGTRETRGDRTWNRRRESTHTTHLSIVDAQGGAVSFTTTVNSWYGSKLVAEGTGVLLNNDMDDFTAKPGAPNQFGLVQGAGNVIGPGRRMLSAMTPTIVLDPDDRLLMVVGTPGGSTIFTTVFQVISNVVDYGMSLSQAVLAPRVHHQHLPDELRYEPAGLPSTVKEALGTFGHRLVEMEERTGDVQAIEVLGDGSLRGQSDPRRGGSAAGY